MRKPIISERLFTFGAGLAVGFGAGIAVRTGLPRATEIAGLILEKLGFEVADIFLSLWDPEGAANQALLPPPKVLPPAKVREPAKKKKKGPVARRNGKPSTLSVARRSARNVAVSSLN